MRENGILYGVGGNVAWFPDNVPLRNLMLRNDVGRYGTINAMKKQFSLYFAWYYGSGRTRGIGAL